MKSKKQGLSPQVPVFDQQVAKTQKPAVSNYELQSMLQQAQTPSVPTPNITLPGTESSTPTSETSPPEISIPETTQPTTPTPTITLPGIPRSGDGGGGGGSSFSNGVPTISSVYTENVHVSKDQSTVDVYFSGIDPDWDPLSLGILHQRCCFWIWVF